jgi:hypothetical protein
VSRCLSVLTTLVVASFLTVPVVGQDSAESQESRGEPAVGEKVLRHAVYFKFKESASESDVQGVVDTFSALEDAVPSIIGFEKGINNSPEKLDDGFTHCFMVTFADEKGLQSYLPHPGHLGLVSKATPFAENLFVVDYVGKQDDSERRQLRHAVYFKFKGDASADDIAKVEKAFADLPSKIETIKGFEAGTNLKPGRYDHGFTHCFLLTFDSEEGRSAYLPHPDHKAFGQMLGPILDKVRVLDYWTGE